MYCYFECFSTIPFHIISHNGSICSVMPPAPLQNLFSANFVHLHILHYNNVWNILSPLSFSFDQFDW